MATNRLALPGMDQCRPWQQLHSVSAGVGSGRLTLPQAPEILGNPLRQQCKCRRFDGEARRRPLRCGPEASSRRDTWKLSDGNREDVTRRRRKGESPYPLSDANARRVIKERARWESQLRKNQGSNASVVPWITRSPQQMEDYLADNKWQARWRRRYKRHVETAITRVRQLASVPAESINMSQVMRPWFGLLSLRDMCTVLKEQRGWRPARDFFNWMKSQVPFRASVVVYTILLRIYGAAGKLDLAEELLREMDEEECELDDVAYSTMIQTYGKAQEYDKMIATYAEMQQNGLIPSITIFTTMIFHLYKASRLSDALILWQQLLEAKLEPLYHTYTLIINCLRRNKQEEEALLVFDKMKKARFAPDEILYNMAISMLCKLERYEEAVTAFEAMKAQGIEPNRYSYATMINVCGKAGDYRGAAALFAEMRESGFPPDEVVFSTVINIFGKARLYAEAEKLFEELGGALLLTNEKTYVMMANLRLKAGNLSGAIELLSEIQMKGLPMNNFAWDTLLLCHVKDLNLSRARLVFHSMLDLGVASIVSYTNMVNLYGMLGLEKDAEDIYRKLRLEETERLDSEFFGAMVKVHCTANNLDAAEAIVRDMEMEGIMPNDIIKTTLAAAYGRVGRLRDAEACFRSSEGDGAAIACMINLFDKSREKEKAAILTNSLTKEFDSMDAATLNFLTRRFARAGDLRRAEPLYAEIIGRGYGPEVKTVASMIQLFGKEGQVTMATRIFEGSRELGLAFSPVVYHAAIDMYAKNNKLEEAVRLYKVAESVCGLTSVSFSIMIRAYSKAGMFEEMASLVETAKSGGVPFDVVMLNTIIKAYLEAGKPAVAMTFFSDMLASGVQPSLQTYTTLMSVCSKAGQPGDAARFFESLKISGCGVDEMAYTEMINCYLRAGRYQAAAEVFGEMEDAGIQPSKVSYNTMIKVYNKAGLPGEAEKMYHQMREQGQSPDPITYLLLISTYGRLKKPKEAELILREMREQGWAPDNAHYTGVILSYGETGLVDDATRMFAEMQTYGIKADSVCYRTMLKIFLKNRRFEEGVSFFKQFKEASSDEKVRNLSFALLRGARTPVGLQSQLPVAYSPAVSA